MKKELNRVWLIFFLVTWVLYMGSHFLICQVRGNEFDLLERSTLATFNAVIGKLAQAKPAIFVKNNVFHVYSLKFNLFCIRKFLKKLSYDWLLTHQSNSSSVVALKRLPYPKVSTMY